MRPGGGNGAQPVAPSQTTKLRKKAALEQQQAAGTAKQRRQPGSKRGNKSEGSAAEGGSKGRWYSLVTGFPFPLGPFFTRQTVRTEVVKGQVWCFQQPQNLAGSNVHTNVRMTAVKLRSGGLLIYAPIAATRECIRLVNELGLPVEVIMLPSFAYEHKVFVGPFSRRFPKAQVYVAPEQWSFPLRLPLPFFGIFGATSIQAGEAYAWSDDFDHRVLTVNISKGVGPYSEVALFHRSTKTLLLVDAAVSVPKEPPPVIPKWALADAGDSSNFFVRLLYGDASQKRQELESAADDGIASEESRRERIGWMRMCLQVLFFAPVNLLEPEMSFRRFAGRLIVSPVVRVLVFSKTPGEVADWIDDMARSWRFKQIIPCHFDAPIAAGPADLRAAFAWAFEAAGKAPPGAPLLDRLNNILTFGRGPAIAPKMSGAPEEGGTRPGGGGTKPGDLFDAEDLKALQALSGALRKAGVTIDDP